MGHRVLRVTRASRGIRATMVILAHRDRRETPVKMGRMAFRDQPVSEDLLATWDPRAMRDSRVSRALQKCTGTASRA
jgi:hypothetical protein